MENQYLLDIAKKRFIKEIGPLKGPPRAFLLYEYKESKQPNQVPFKKGIYLYFPLSLESNQLIWKVNEGPKVFCSQL